MLVLIGRPPADTNLALTILRLLKSMLVEHVGASINHATLVSWQVINTSSCLSAFFMVFLSVDSSPSMCLMDLGYSVIIVKT